MMIRFNTIHLIIIPISVLMMLYILILFYLLYSKELQYLAPLKEVEGKSLTLTVCLNKENLIGGSTVYYASDVTEGIETSASCSALEKTEQNYTLVSVVV
jgi:hypothetical protein